MVGVRARGAEVWAGVGRMDMVGEDTWGGEASLRSRRKKVLVIDDNRAIAELIRYALDMRGEYVVVVAHDGAQGLEVMVRERPDCVIVDVLLPGMDGFAVVRHIRADAALAHTPLLILSALTDSQSQQVGLRSGVDEYLTKPFRPSALCAAVERVISITPTQRAERLERLAAEG